MKTLIPAYGRDYKSKKAVLIDWFAKKDFLIADITDQYDGKPTNIDDWKDKDVMIRYKNLTQICVINSKTKEPKPKPEAKPKPKPFKVEVVADNSGKFYGNGLTFETQSEAKDYAKDLMSRWLLVTNWQIVKQRNGFEEIVERLHEVE